MIVVLIGSLNNWQKEKQFKVLNEKREEHVIKVIRDGEEQMINIHSIVVGDVVFEPSKIMPCDGIFLSGHNVRCSKSGAMGKSEVIKLSYEPIPSITLLPLTTKAVCMAKQIQAGKLRVPLQAASTLTVTGSTIRIKLGESPFPSAIHL